MKEIIVRKPNPPKFFGISALYERYSNRWYKWRALLPNNGDKIKLTWLPNPINHPHTKNAYIGMEGVVCDMDKNDGGFTLKCETNILTGIQGNFNYHFLVNT